MQEKFKILFTKDEIERIKENITGNRHSITVDLHGMAVRDAQRLIKNLVVVNRDTCTLGIVHGYNHGTALKNMIWNDFTSPRIMAKRTATGNPGKTFLDIASAA